MKESSARFPLAHSLIAVAIALFGCLLPGCESLPETLLENQDQTESMAQPAPAADEDNRRDAAAEPPADPGHAPDTDSDPRTTADFDGDGVVTDHDRRLFSAAFGSAEGDPKFNPVFDLDGDKQITLVDMQIFAALAEQSGV